MIEENMEYFANEDIDLDLDTDESYGEANHLRQQYWKLGSASWSNGKAQLEKPLTCFLHPKLTPARLLEFLNSRGASEACILYWMRHLQEIRGLPDSACMNSVTGDHDYAVKMMGK